MISADTLDELWLHTLNELLAAPKQESRDGGTTEQLGFVMRLTDPTAGFLFNPERKLSPSYAAAELLWYLSGSDEIEMMKAYAPQYVRFSDDGVTANGAYGKRLMGTQAYSSKLLTSRGLNLDVTSFFSTGEFQSMFSQLQVAAAILKKTPASRQAVVVLWRDEDCVSAYDGVTKDLPCTLSLQFLLRDGKLNLIVNMRSNDVWLGLPYDVWCFTGFQRIVAEALDVELGWYQHQAGSMHLYDRDLEKAKLAATVRSFNTGPLTFDRHPFGLRSAIHTAVAFERHNRSIRTCAHRGFDDELGHLCFLGQCVVLASLKFSDSGLDRVSSSLMKSHIKR